MPRACALRLVTVAEDGEREAEGLGDGESDGCEMMTDSVSKPPGEYDCRLAAVCLASVTPESAYRSFTRQGAATQN